MEAPAEKVSARLILADRAVRIPVLLVFVIMLGFGIVAPSRRMARTMSVFYGGLNVGIIAGGPIGGVVAHVWGLRSPLFLYAGLCFVSGVLYLRYMPHPNAPQVKAAAARPAAGGPAGWRAKRAQVFALLRNPTFLTVLVLNMAFYWVVAGGYDTLVTLFGKEGLGMSTVGIGGVFAIAVQPEFIVLYPAGGASGRVGRE